MEGAKDHLMRYRVLGSTAGFGARAVRRKERCRQAEQARAARLRRVPAEGRCLDAEPRSSPQAASLQGTRDRRAAGFTEMNPPHDRPLCALPCSVASVVGCVKFLPLLAVIASSLLLFLLISKLLLLATAKLLKVALDFLVWIRQIEPCNNKVVT